MEVEHDREYTIDLDPYAWASDEYEAAAASASELAAVLGAALEDGEDEEFLPEEVLAMEAKVRELQAKVASLEDAEDQDDEVGEAAAFSKQHLLEEAWYSTAAAEDDGLEEDSDGEPLVPKDTSVIAAPAEVVSRLTAENELLRLELECLRQEKLRSQAQDGMLSAYWAETPIGDAALAGGGGDQEVALGESVEFALFTEAETFHDDFSADPVSEEAPAWPEPFDSEFEVPSVGEFSAEASLEDPFGHALPAPVTPPQVLSAPLPKGSIAKAEEDSEEGAEDTEAALADRRPRLRPRRPALGSQPGGLATAFEVATADAGRKAAAEGWPAADEGAAEGGGAVGRRPRLRPPPLPPPRPSRSQAPALLQPSPLALAAGRAGHGASSSSSSAPSPSSSAPAPAPAPAPSLAPRAAAAAARPPALPPRRELRPEAAPSEAKRPRLAAAAPGVPRLRPSVKAEPSRDSQEAFRANIKSALADVAARLAKVQRTTVKTELPDVEDSAALPPWRVQDRCGDGKPDTIVVAKGLVVSGLCQTRYWEERRRLELQAAAAAPTAGAATAGVPPAPSAALGTLLRGLHGRRGAAAASVTPGRSHCGKGTAREGGDGEEGDEPDEIAIAEDLVVSGLRATRYWQVYRQREAGVLQGVPGEVAEDESLHSLFVDPLKLDEAASQSAAFVPRATASAVARISLKRNAYGKVLWNQPLHTAPTLQPAAPAAPGIPTKSKAAAMAAAGRPLIAPSEAPAKRLQARRPAATTAALQPAATTATLLQAKPKAGSAGVRAASPAPGKGTAAGTARLLSGTARLLAPKSDAVEKGRAATMERTAGPRTGKRLPLRRCSSTWTPPR